MIVRLVAVLALLFANHHAFADYGPVERIATDKFMVESDGETLYAPMLIYAPPRSPDTAVTRLVCLQHGAARNPFSYLESMVKAVTAAGVQDHTAVVAFQWLEEKDIDAHRGNASLKPDKLLYFSSDWRAGNRSLSTDENPRPFRISNFDVIDRFLLASVDRFPNLKEITVTGHSAGGQVVNRYALATNIENSLPSDRAISIQYIIFNPSSYLYLDERRWNTQTRRFQVPTKQQIRNAPNYNSFKYGLEDTNEYLLRARRRDGFASYPTRKVIYGLGEEDNDPDHKDLDKSPEAMLQGTDRLSRGVIYFKYLTERFGPELLKHQRFVVLPEVGHSSGDCFGSASGLNLLFGVGRRDDGPVKKYGITNGD